MEVYNYTPRDLIDLKTTVTGYLRETGLVDIDFLTIVGEATDSLAERSANWIIPSESGTSKFWINVNHEPSMRPDQGWKLHVSAAVRSAETVLHRTLSVLLTEDADFKVAASLWRLAALNEGAGSISQIGKFITVYPNDDVQAVRMAVALDAATQGLEGPKIPSDRPLAPQSLVHYRYGAFGNVHLTTPLGEILPALSTPEGTLVPDRRLTRYVAPDWVIDPFLAAGVASKFSEQNRRLGENYVILTELHHSPRSTVHLCLDTANLQLCVIKRVTVDAEISQHRLIHESQMLERVAVDRRFPKLYELLELDGDHVLVMEDVRGETFEQHLARRLMHGRTPSTVEVIAWGLELSAMVQAIHATNLVFRDLKPTNIIVAPNGQLRLIDFDLAVDIDSQAKDFASGTRGYMSPQQQSRQPASLSDDIYGLGALLFLASTGAEPSHAPNPSSLLDRPIELLNPTIHSSLTQVISRCLDPEPSRRFASMPEIDSALTAIDDVQVFSPSSFGSEQPTGSGNEALQRSREHALRLGDALCSTVLAAMGGFANGTSTTDRIDERYWALDLNSGIGGLILALAELVAALGVPAHREILTSGARWIRTAPSPHGSRLPGLYVGDCGVGAALLRAGQVLGDDDLISAADDLGHQVAALPYASPDLFHGSAGRARFHLLLWDELADPKHLAHAKAAGDDLLASASETGCGGANWTIPEGYGGLSNGVLTGYAHGAAGIADVLLDIYEAMGDSRYLAAAQKAGRWLESLAIPTLNDETGLNWPVHEGEASLMAFWCHGASGVGRFFRHLSEFSGLPNAMEVAARAARTAARGVRWAGPSQCHGLSGNIEFLLDMYQYTRDPAYHNEAKSLAQLLNAFARTTDDRQVTWITDANGGSNPGFMIGSAGIAVCLLRLVEPETRPHLLSRRGFRN